MYFQEIEWGWVEWIDLPQVKVNWRVPGNAAVDHREHRCVEFLD
jgi:hypothetical protein